MVGSSEHILFDDESASVIMLNMKHNQNMILDLDSSRYNEVFRLIIECLKFSPLAQALTITEYVPLIHHHKAYSSAIYNKADDIIHFEFASHKPQSLSPTSTNC
ncbi:unnamed protein product [Lactuca saligna]|uniref:Uncharacterized protein n=1 Tax=Lactuca saligna TaxID=75948 RepID=A0AA35YFG7_LACSI|nr:unnamed protein product [Lactuca saligna]